MHPTSILKPLFVLALLLFTNVVLATNPIVPVRTYDSLKLEILATQKQYQRDYSKADTLQKDSILKVAQAYVFETLVNDLFPYWYGTAWDFNGTTRKPGQGGIACGYFVTNTLTDLGFEIPRIKWAQSASEVFIRVLAKDNMARFSNTSMEKIEAHFQKTGDGVYLVGLDMHTGYVVVKNGISQFVHSNYYQPDIGVMAEELNSGNPLSDSSYRVIGKLFSDKMMGKWLSGESY